VARTSARALPRGVAALFRVLSDARGARIFHPHGVAFRARWEPADGTPLSPASPLARAPHDAVVRLSRAIGLPEGVPDILGVAIKVLDVHGPGHDQDLLLASSGSTLVTRRALVPTRDFTRAVFSSLLPYRVASRRTVVEARVASDRSWTFADVETVGVLTRRGGATLPTVEVSLRSGGLAATVPLLERLDDQVAADLRFDPWHTGDDLTPTGWLNRLRRPAYDASQQGRDAPAAGARADLGSTDERRQA
jgi:hypothetical protein